MDYSSFSPPNYSVLSALENDKDQLSQDKESLIAEQSWLTTQHPMGAPPNAADFRMMALVNGDSFIGGTAYEGATSSDVLSFFNRFFSQLPADQAEPEIATLIKEAWAISIGLCCSYGHYKNMIKELVESREKIWFPTGWTDRITSSHAVMLEINYTENSITIYNTGDGVGAYHKMTQLNSIDPTEKQNWSSKVQGFIKLTHCDPEKIKSPELYQFLFELKNSHTTDSNIVLGAENLIEGLIKYLGAKIEKDLDPIQEPLFFRQPQRAGTCSARSLLSAIYYTLLKRDKTCDKYKYLKFLWQSWLLVAAMQRDISSEEKNLLEDIVSNMARAVEKTPLKNTLPAEIKLQWEATLLEIESKLQSIESRPREDETEVLQMFTTEKTLLINPSDFVPQPQNQSGSVDKGTIESHHTIFSLPNLRRVSAEEIDEMEINSALAEMKRLAANLQSNEDISLIYSYFARIAQFAWEDPQAKLDDYSINIDSIKEHLADPYAIYLHPQSHRQLKKALDLLDKQGDKKKLFTLDIDGSITISHDTLKKDPTLLYFSQFLKDENRSITILEELQQELVNPTSLPISVRALYEAWRVATAIFRSIDEFHLPQNPSSQMVSQSPTVIRINFGFKGINNPIPPLFQADNYLHLLEGRAKQNEIVSLRNSSINFSRHSTVNRTLQMTPLDLADIPNRLIAFFKRNIDLLSEPEMAGYILSQFFRPLILLEQIEAEPTFINLLEQFFSNAIDHFIEKGEYTIAVNYIMVSNRIEKFLSEAGYPADFTKGLARIVDLIIPLANKKGNSLKTSELFNLILNEFSPQNGSKEHLADLATYIFLSTKEGIPVPPHRTSLWRVMSQDMTADKLTFIEQQVIQCMGLLEGFYNFDFQAMKVSRPDGTPVVSQTDFIQNNPLLHFYFKGKEPKISQKGNRSFFSSEERSLIVTSINDASKITFSKIIDGIEYFYRGFAEDLKVERIIMEKSSRGEVKGTFWGLTRDDIDYSYYDEKLFLDNETNTVTFKFVYYNRSSAKFTRPEAIKEVTRLSDGARFQNNVEWNGYGSPTLKLANVWIDNHFKIVQFSYRRFEFSSKNVGGEPRLYCEQYPGYFLVQSTLTGSVEEPHFMLSNSAGQKLTLISLPKEVTKKYNSPPRLVACKFENSQLVGTNLDANLYLILSHIKKKEYNLAFQLTSKLNLLESIQDNAKLYRFENISFSILFKTLEVEGHPDAIAIYLRLAKFYLLNKVKYPEKIYAAKNPPPFNEVTLSDKLTQYAFNETNCTSARLSPKEKISLIKILTELYPEQNFIDLASEWQGYIIMPKITTVEDTNPPLPGRGSNWTPGRLLYSPQTFSNKLQELIEIARSGSSEQRKWLKDVLDFNHAYLGIDHSYTTIHTHFRWRYLPSFLISAQVPLDLAISGYYRSIINYFAASQDKRSLVALDRNVTAAPIPLDTAAMRETDKSFDAYLFELKERHFKCEPVEQPLTLETLPTEHPLASVRTRLERENADLAYFRENLLQEPVEIQIDEIEELQANLTTTCHELTAQLKNIKISLLWQLNQGNTFKRLGYKRPLVWSDLKRLSLKGNFNQFLERTLLNEEEAERLLNSTGFYLVLESRLNQMETISSSLAKIQRESGSLSRQQLLINQAFETITTFTSDIRDYTYVNRLWIECGNKYLYRANQIEKLQELTEAQASSPEIQAEMPTGYGKSKLIIPTLNMEMIKAGWAVVNCWPPTLEMTNTADMQAQMQKSGEMAVDRLFFDRTSNFKATDLAVIYQSLVENRANGVPINCSPDAIKSLELHFLLTLDQDPVEYNKVFNFIRILSFFRKEKTWASLDEEHFILHPMDRLIYAVGDKTLLPDRDVGVIEKLFDYLNEKPYCNEVHLTSQASQRLTKEEYALMARELALEFHAYLSSDADEEEFISYVTGAQHEEPQWLVNNPKKEEIALVRGCLSFILEESLKCSVDRDFGFSNLHFNKKEFAIAYCGSNTPKENEESPSQYMNPHETLVKTLISYFYKGLSEKQIKTMISGLQERMRLAALQGIAVPATEAYKAYNRFNVSLKTPLSQLNERDIELITPELVKNKEAIFYYVKTYIVPQIEIYEDSISSNAQNFKSQFASALSLSATPQDVAAHGSKTVFVPMRGTSGQVTHLLLTKCESEDSIHQMSGNSPSEILDQVAEKVEGRSQVKAIIDIGAQFKGLTNYKVALRLAENSDVQAVVFMDEKEGKFKIYDKATQSIMDYSTADIPPESRHTYYDQNRCFGSDIHHTCDAAAILLTDKDTKAKIGQGIGRMRQLHKGQTIEVAVPGHHSEKDNIKKLLLFWIENQIEQEARLNFYSQLQQYDNILRRAVIDRMLDHGDNLRRVVQLFSRNRDLFISTNSISPYKLYATRAKSSPAKGVLEKRKEAIKEKARRTFGLLPQERQLIINDLDNCDIEKLHLPEAVAESSDINMECEVLQEIEVEVEVEVEVETETESTWLVELQRPIVWSEKIDIFKNGWERAGPIYPLFKRAISNLTGRLPGTFLDEAFLLGHTVKTASVSWLKEYLNLRGLTPLTLFALITIRVSSLAFEHLDLLTPTSHLLTVALHITKFVLSLFATGSVLVVSSTIVIFSVSGIGASLGKLIESGSIYWIEKTNADNYICRVDEIMKMHLPKKQSIEGFRKNLPPIYECNQLFAPNFYATNNFWRTNSLDIETKERVFLQKPLDIDQKPILDLLLIEDTGWWGRKNLKVVAIDKNDSVFLRRKLAEEKNVDDLTAGKRSRKIAIYDPANEIITTQGKNKFDFEELRERPQFIEAVASAKFLNGDIGYTEKELDYLEGKINLIGKKIVAHFFINKILQPFQPNNLLCLREEKSSRLYRMLASKKG